MHEGISVFTYLRCFSYLVILSGDFFCTFYSPSSRWWKQSWYRQQVSTQSSPPLMMGRGMGSPIPSHQEGAWTREGPKVVGGGQKVVSVDPFDLEP